ncbi:hypothetical protein GCM10011609_38250 [Lentzea pudingi]|uniref:Secreted protein n=1 Tax=Lentzea pudingi TaxID=1789439 RepID=A0ABQ2I0G7_9PSEU|nr:hypothetical protein [Lentzea pudingi]GGM96817.1 hypothetical protein GCM10011609_38250 [Lentzea pudingi]
MKRALPVSGVLVLARAVVAVVVWQRPEDAPPVTGDARYDHPEDRTWIAESDLPRQFAERL